MQRLHFKICLLFALAHSACRTNNENKIEMPVPKVAEFPLIQEDANAPVLQKVIGELTKGHPENRLEVCTLIKSDFQDLDAVKAAIATVKEQALQTHLMVTAVVPSLQYFAYVGKEAIVLSERGSAAKIRVPADGQGNPSLDLLMKHLDEGCGVNDARP